MLKKYLTALKVTICEVMEREYEVILISSKDIRDNKKEKHCPFLH